MSDDFQVSGNNASAPFTLKLHRGEGMLLLAMNWRSGKPPLDFVGFAIQYREPGGDRFFSLKNRLAFAPPASSTLNPPPGPPGPLQLSTLLSPIQSFRWVHFPFRADLPGAFTYRVTPVFMNEKDELSVGPAQEADIELRRETFPGLLNVAFTRGFVSSQAFVDRWANDDGIKTLLPAKADTGLRFKPTHPKAAQALAWMGFEARALLLQTLDEALADTTAQVCVVAYDLNEPELVNRLVRLGPRLRIIIDDDGAHGAATSAESQAEQLLLASAGATQVKRQHLGGLQHNKLLVVDGKAVQKVLCGSTNWSWRGLYVQANNAVVLQGRKPVRLFRAAFDAYVASNAVADFAATPSVGWQTLGLKGVNAQVTFSPHSAANGVLGAVGLDIDSTRSSLFYSLAFLAQTPGVVKEAIKRVSRDNKRFVYGMADQALGGIVLNMPDGNVAPVSPAALSGNVPPPFKTEPVGGGGVRLHHKFVVIDFDKPSARVYMGSYNFSIAADSKNGENLLLIRNRRVAVAYMVEALRLFDHYRFRNKQAAATKARPLQLRKPPRLPGELPWWHAHYTEVSRIRDRLLFSA